MPPCYDVAAAGATAKGAALTATEFLTEVWEGRRVVVGGWRTPDGAMASGARAPESLTNEDLAAELFAADVLDPARTTFADAVALVAAERAHREQL